MDAPVRLPDLPAPYDRLDWRPLTAQRNARKSGVLLAEHEGRTVVAKHAPAAARWTPVGLYRRFALKHEVEALRALAGIPGVPALLAAGPTGFVLAHAPGAPLAEWPRGRVPARVFDELDRIVDAIHGRGFVVGDLHRRNILVDEAAVGRRDADGTETPPPAGADPGRGVHVIDYELALDRRRLLGRLLGGRIARVDGLSLARTRQKYGVPLEARHVQTLEAGWPWPYNWGRAFKVWLHDRKGHEPRARPESTPRTPS